MNVYLKNEAIALVALFIFFSSVCHVVLAGSSTQLGSTYQRTGARPFFLFLMTNLR